MSEVYKPTARVRFVERDGALGGRVLQQWWAPDLPGYMADPGIGEWRDVPMGVEAP